LLPAVLPFIQASDWNTTFRDGKIAHYRGTEDTAQTEAVLHG
jgi:ketosteroid isomerase-like protein